MRKTVCKCSEERDDDVKKNEFLAGEVAKICGISTETVRYYNKIGLLFPRRKEENNYRYFDQGNIGDVHSVTLLRALGMPIEKIQTFFKTGSLKVLNKLIVEQRKQIEGEINRLYKQQVELLRFQMQLEIVQNFTGEITVRQSPEWRMLCENTDKDMQKMVHVYHELMHNVDFLPTYAFIMEKDVFLADDRTYYKYCLLVDPRCENVEDIDGVIPSQKCVYYVYQGREDEELTEVYWKLHQWIEENHFKVSGDIVERFILSTPEGKIMELWIPIEG